MRGVSRYDGASVRFVNPRPDIRALVAAVVTALALFCPPPASAQIVVKANDTVNLKLGILGQFWVDTIHDTETDDDITNLFVRRFRLMLAGQVAKNVTFFADTDVPNLGKTVNGVKTSPSMILQDAYGEFKASDGFMLDAGYMYVPFSHNALQAAPTLLPIDYGTYTFSQSAPTQGVNGRDAGFQARGYLGHDHLEYRLGAFQGHRNSGSTNPMRVAGRAQFNVLQADKNFFYGGTSLGAKKVLSFGGAFDHQEDFNAYDGDIFFDHPLGPGAITSQFNYNRFDGGETLTTLGKQDDVLVEAGYYVTALKLTPWLQWQRRDFADTDSGDETRTGVGASYYWAAHNANIKAGYTHIAPHGVGSQRQFTIQFQIFYF